MAVARTTEAMSMLKRKKFAILLALCQIVLIVLFAMFCRYSDDAQYVAYLKQAGSSTWHLTQTGTNYAAFQDVQLMVVVGFALMAAVLKRYAMSGMGYNLLIAAIAIQWGLFLHEMMLTRLQGVALGVQSLMTGSFAATAVIVSFGAVMGKMSPHQLMFMTLIEILFYTVNKYVGHLLFQASDMGHSMYVHLFGAVFGLLVGRMNAKTFHRRHPQQTAQYHSDIYAILGALFLWICFPSFNAAFCPEALRQRAIVNTLMATMASTMATFVVSVLLSTEDRFNVRHVQNAVIAGGIAIGTTAATVHHPYVAMVTGAIAGVMAVLGIEYKQKCIADRFNCHDTRVVFSIHGVSAFVGVVISMVVCGLANEETFGKENLYLAYPAMVPTNATSDGAVVSWVRDGRMQYGDERSAGQQALYQFYTLLATVCIGTLGGCMTGFLLSFDMCDMPNSETAFDDRQFWTVHEEGMAPFEQYTPMSVAVEMQEQQAKAAEDTVELKTHEVTAIDEDDDKKTADHQPTETNH